MLGYVIEQITGKTYRSAMRELVLEPVGMKSTVLEGYENELGAIAEAYGPDTSGWDHPMHAEPLSGSPLFNYSQGHHAYNAWAWAAGGYAMTSTDLDRFGRAVLAGRIEAMPDQAGRFALPDPRSRYDWNGGSFGIQASLWIVPEHSIAISVLSNTTLPNGQLNWVRDLLAPLEAAAIETATSAG